MSTLQETPKLVQLLAAVLHKHPEKLASLADVGPVRVVIVELAMFTPHVFELKADPCAASTQSAEAAIRQFLEDTDCPELLEDSLGSARDVLAKEPSAICVLFVAYDLNHEADCGVMFLSADATSQINAPGGLA